MSKTYDGIFGEDIVVSGLRIFWPRIYTPGDAESFTPGKYSCELIKPKSEGVVALEKAAIALIKRKWGEKVDLSRFNLGIKDGDDRAARLREADKEDTAKLYDGQWVLFPKSKERPTTFGPKLESLPDDTIYGGCYVAAKVTPFTYSMGPNQGVSWKLNSIQFVRDGERVGTADKDPRSGFSVADEYAEAAASI